MVEAHRSQYDPARPLRTQEGQEDGHRASANIAGWNEKYINARSEWDARFSTHVKRERLWQRMFLGCLALCAVSVIGVVTVSNRMTIVPHIVEVDKTGTIVASYSAQQVVNATLDEAIIRSLIERWVRSFRTVSVDRTMQNQLMLQADSMLAPQSQARSRVQALWAASNPFHRSAEVVVYPKVDEIRRIGQDTWYIRWHEEVTATQGGSTNKVRYAATLTTARGAIDESRRLWNPLGVYVTQIDFTGKPETPK